MKRLLENLGKNSPEAYDQIFKTTMPDWFDIRRWKTLLKYYKGGNLVDLGCLFSQICEMVKDKPGVYLGIDEAKEAIERMKLTYNNTRTQFEVGDIYNLDIEDDIMDYVVLGEVVEHLEYPGGAIKEALRILKPGGTLAISTPLEEAKEPGAVDKDRHIWSFSKHDLELMLTPYGNIKFKILRSRWFPYKYCWPQLLIWVKKYDKV